MAIIKVDYGELTGGGALTLDTFKVVSVTNTNLYTFTKDYKYVIMIDGTNSSPSQTWYEKSIRINGNIKSGMQGGYITNSKLSSTYIIYTMLEDIKNGDTLSVTAGSYNLLLIGLV